jgi:putative nucleotidyltransferase with HDIG domain
MKHTKTITIDQLKPGMFIVGMDQPWHRTPFLIHKRLIRHTKEIDLLRRHGVRELQIDPNQGLDVEPVQSEIRPHPTVREATVAQFNQPVEPALLKEVPHPHDSRESGTAPPSMQEDALSPRARKQATAAQKTYSEAIASIERMFEELETGLAPRPETSRVIVTNILKRVLDDSPSMLSLFALEKMKRFDRTLASHALDVCTLSLIVARTYGVEESEMEALGAGALLHDIGYLRLPRNLYRRPHDLPEQDQMMMRQHPALGLTILREIQETRDAVVRIVMEHHERGNGSGFPRQLTSDSISILAQLVGLTDTYDSLVSRRGGHPAMLPHDAIKQLFRLGDTGHYAKDLVPAMISSLGVYPIGSLVLLNTGEQAVVVEINHTQRLKPVVKVLTGTQGGSYLTPIRIDLRAQESGAIERSIAKVLDPLHEHVNVAMFLNDVDDEAA